MIHEFDFVIYPIKLWITIDATKKELEKKFPRSNKWNNHDWGAPFNFRGMVYYVRNEDYSGPLIRLNPQDDSGFSYETVAHESTHAAEYVCDDCYWTHDIKNGEPYAYLVGFIAKCCAEAIEDYKKGQRKLNQQTDDNE